MLPTPFLLGSLAAAAPPPLVVELDCPGLAGSRHSLVATGLTGKEVASAVVPVTPGGRTQVVLSPTAIPARLALVGASCNMEAEVEGDLVRPFEVRLSTRPASEPAPAAQEGRSPAALGAVVAEALAAPPGNAAETRLAGVPRLDGHPLDRRLQVELSGRPATVLVGPACACPEVPAGSRATATRVGDVVVVSAHDGPDLVVVLPEPADTIAQVLCGCAAAAPLWLDEERQRAESRTARRSR